MNESLWLDEATTALVSRMSIADIFGKFLPGDFHPPLYYLVMKFWVSLFGNSEIVLRFPSLIFAVLTVFLVYKLAGRRSALLLATAPLLFYYAQEARMYVMAMFFVTLAVFSFVKMRKEKRVGWRILFSISLALIAATDYVSLLILPIFWYLGRVNWKKLLMSHIILVGFWVVWLPYFAKQLNAGLNVASVSPAWWQILGQSNFKNLALIPVKFMIGRISFDDKWLYGLMVAMVGSLFGYLLFRSIRLIRIISNLSLFWLWLIVPLILGVAVSFWIPTLSYFRYLFILPAFYILVASGVGKSRLFLWLVLAVNILSTMYYVLNPRFHREDWRSAAQALGSLKVVFPTDSQKEALTYYGRGGQIISLSDVDEKDKELWLSRYVWEIVDPKDEARSKMEGLGYEKLQEYNFNGVVFYKYANSD